MILSILQKKLDISTLELKELMKGENKTYRDYKNSMSLISIGAKVLQWTGIQRAIIR